MARLRHILLLVVPLILFPVVFIYDVVRATVDLEVSGLNYVREGIIVLSFLLLYFFIEDRRLRNKKGTTKEIGRLLIISFVALTIIGLVSLLQSVTTSNGDRPSTMGIFFSVVIGVVLGSTSLYTLQTIKDLVLFKRRKGTRRNYILYLVMLFAASAAALPFLSFEGSLFTTLFFPVAVILVIVNSFKQNWIVYLSRREKIYSIIYSALLFVALVLLNVLLAQNTLGNKLLLAFSRPLHTFIQLNAVFGAVYFGMAFVSTLFHLPTAEVFERKQSELNSLHNLSRLVTQVFDFNDLVNTVTQMTMEVCGPKSAWLELLQPSEKKGEIKVEVVSKRNISNEQIDAITANEESPLRSILFESKKVLLIDDVWSDRRMKHLKKAGLLKGSLLSVPLLSHGELIGVLHATKDFENGFDQDDIDVMTTFADHVTIAIENSKLITKSLERERLQQEMMVAQRMQKRLLPQRVPELRGVDVAVASESSMEVGGDYYDFVSLPQQQLGIAVGDVSGKGVSAAFYMAEMKGIFLSLSKICSSPRDLLVKANHTLMESLDKGAFISLIYAILDSPTGTIKIARAGHCPVIYISDGNCELVRPTGLGLGLTNGTVFEQSTEERTLRLKRGDVCIFYTDGITESRNSEGEEFGYDRLIEIAKNSKDLSADGIKNRIIQSVRTFMGHLTYSDDMTLVVIKWIGMEDSRPQ